MVKVEHLSKKYKIYPRPANRLKEWLTFSFRQYHTEFWALTDVSFEVAKGGILGIIGPNGAGKSTLLKILTGITPPTIGMVQIHGRVAALLELGSGFHPEFTGRQNIVLSAKILGLSAEEICNATQDIIEFSELGPFIDQPLRTYSTGMYMRLGFAVAASVHPEVLIIDEALSVGDAYFQAKCIKRLREFKACGATILFVSHDLAAMKTFCDEVLLLDQGQVADRGKPDAVLEYYNALIAKRTAQHEFFAIEKQYDISSDSSEPSTLRAGSFEVLILRIDLLDQQGRSARVFISGEQATIDIEVAVLEEVCDPTVGILIRDRLGNDVFGTNTYNLRIATGSYGPGEQFRVRYRLPMHLGPGNYTLTAAVHSLDVHLYDCYDWAEKLLAFKVLLPADMVFTGVARLDVRAESIEKREAACDPRELLATLFAHAPSCLEMHSAFAKYLVKGWHEVEEIGGDAVRWTRQHFSFILRVQQAEALCFDLCSFMPGLHEDPIQVSVFNVQQQLAQFAVAHNDFRKITLNIAGKYTPGVTRFSVHLNTSWSPSQTHKTGDQRDLGVLIRKIWVE